MNQYDKKKLLNYIDTVSFALIDSADIDDHFTWATDSWPWMKKGGCQYVEL